MPDGHYLFEDEENRVPFCRRGVSWGNRVEDFVCPGCVVCKVVSQLLAEYTVSRGMTILFAARRDEPRRFGVKMGVPDDRRPVACRVEGRLLATEMWVSLCSPLLWGAGDIRPHRSHCLRGCLFAGPWNKVDDLSLPRA